MMMLFKSVEIENFRNHSRSRLALGSGVNVLVGNNAMGKTNILEAVYFTCVGRGFRSARDRDMIKFGADKLRVKSVAAKKFGDISVEIIVDAHSKQILINQIPIAKMGELMGSVTCVFFNPDELKLVKESPADRRRFMDIDISQMDKNYFYNLLKYNRILKQRNALLKSMGRTESEFRALDIWDEQLANVGEQIIARRVEFCRELLPAVLRVHKEFASNEVVNMNIETVDNLLLELANSREKDLRLKTTSVGSHRDDLLITINGRDVRNFASQGQQRTVALSLKIAELEIFERLTGERPILLLDDVLSELDEHRRAKLLELVRGYQTIITTTEKTPINGAKMFHVEQGTVNPKDLF
jgi:DNA replication and repair protein RecF